MRLARYIGSVIKTKDGSICFIIGLIGKDFHVKYIPCKGYTTRVAPTKFKILVKSKRDE